MRDFQPFCYPAAAARIRLNNRHAIHGNVVSELLFMEQRLPEGDGNRGMGLEFSVTRQVLSRTWFLKPKQVESFPHLSAPDCFRVCEALVGVDHQRQPLPHTFPHCGDTLEVLQWVLFAYFNLYAAESSRHDLFRLVRQL